MSNKLSCTGQPSLLASSWLKVEPTKARSCPSSPFQRTGELQTAEDIHTKLITSAPEVRNIPASHSTVAITSQDFQLETIRSAQTGNDQKASASGNLPDTSRIRSYQIRLVRKGLPDFSFENEEQIRRLMQKRTDLRIVPYWVCQTGQENKRSSLAWIFSITVTFICVIFPLLSFSSDVAFYVACSDHYNHTAEILQEVRAKISREHITLPSELKGSPGVFNKNHNPDYNMETKHRRPVEDFPRLVESDNTNDDSSCEAIPIVIDFMMTRKAIDDLERHRHITINIFEPVFILGSFPSLILSILTRCWHCAGKGDCSGMLPLWWLQDGLTKILLVSVLTKILDGFAGGLVLFVVIIRRLQHNHVRTYWQSVFRIIFIIVAFILCCSISPIMVITPAMMVMRLEFMELATPFQQRESIQAALTVLMTLGVIMWSVSFGTLVIYIVYNMCLYCRERANTL